MRRNIDGQWFWSEDEIDKAYNQGYADGKILALEEDISMPSIPPLYPPMPIEYSESIEEEYDDDDFDVKSTIFSGRSEKNPYHELWKDNARCFGFIKNLFRKYYITEHKIIMQEGFASEKSTPIFLYRVVRSTAIIKWWQRIFHIGDILVQTSKHEYLLKNVHHPKSINAAILKLVDMNRKDRVKVSEWATESETD